MSENERIINAIKRITIERRQNEELYDAFRKDRKVEIDGFIFVEDIYILQIWKRTDIRRNPQWKGQSLLKVLPILLVDSLDWDLIRKNLESQYWGYF